MMTTTTTTATTTTAQERLIISVFTDTSEMEARLNRAQRLTLRMRQKLALSVLLARTPKREILTTKCGLKLISDWDTPENIDKWEKKLEKWLDGDIDNSSPELIRFKTGHFVGVLRRRVKGVTDKLLKSALEDGTAKVRGAFAWCGIVVTHKKEKRKKKKEGRKNNVRTSNRAF